MKEPLATSLEASKLPVEFVNFLKSNMNGVRGNDTGFLRYLHSYPYLDALVAESFRDVDSLGRTDVLFIPILIDMSNRVFSVDWK